MTVISYQLKVKSAVSLKIYDVLGRVVVTLVEGVQGEGLKSIEFNASDLPSGVYYYRLRAGEYSEMKKLILLR